jgi:DnaB-like helicase N terminal domain
MNAVTPFSDPVAHERLLPVNIDAEQELLGAILVRGDAIATVRPILASDHFGERLHGLVYQAILETVDAGHSPSMGSVKQFLGTWNVSSDLGGITLAQYLARVMALAPAVGALTPLAHLVRDLWAIRQIAAVSDDIGRKEEGFDPAAYLAEKFDQLDVVSGRACSTGSAPRQPPHKLPGRLSPGWRCAYRGGQRHFRKPGSAASMTSSEAGCALPH